ncbi:hypothetical protein A2572_01390 [Candidatus Collierbacteria bacterium RIFOXYD1_FULL_40_9]|uniref:Class III signal peptide-containing protein n=1 Tax=Candidatus Collierbacteria bacterium RIFOXYD1_FULL_40_9 TaxID=1817731 RepID=A0A1F5FVL9_9BACT|nr:MAG: hypothetical protein A2572_01390 [Candidatus Collierbacteria bacterium RIFOXYD1_FULL_40_9]
MKSNTIVNEKGQGLVEYALILILVSIIVIAALMIVGPFIQKALGIASPEPSSANVELLSDVRVQYGPEWWNPAFIPIQSISDQNVVDIVNSQTCLPIVPPQGKTVKVGTTYADPSLIDVIPGDNGTIEICSRVVGANVHVYITYVDLPR